MNTSLNNFIQQELCNCCGQQQWQKIHTTYDFMYSKKTPTYDLYQCQHCGLIALDSDKQPETIRAYYPPESYYSYQKQDKFLAIKKRLYILMFSPLSAPLDWLRSIFFYPLLQMMRGIKIQDNAKVLDIGCGSGKFLAIIDALNMQPFGIEISETAIEAAKKVTGNVYLGECERMTGYKFPNNPKMKFDVIVSNHVIEHATNPDKFLQKVKEMLAENGTAIIATPNYYSIWAKLFGRYWTQLDTPRHLFVLAPHNMKIICNKNQMKIIKIRHLSSEVGIIISLIYLFEHKLLCKPNFKLRKILIIFARFLLFPVYTLVNLLRIGDTVEYHLVHKK